MHCSRRLIVQSLVFSRSYLHRQPETLVVKGGTTWARNGRHFRPKAATSTHTLSGSLTCREYTTWDKRLYFPSEGRRGGDFVALKNPTASAGFEPANLGTTEAALRWGHRQCGDVNSRIFNVYGRLCGKWSDSRSGHPCPGKRSFSVQWRKVGRALESEWMLGRKENSLAPAGNRNMPGWVKWNLIILKAYGS